MTDKPLQYSFDQLRTVFKNAHGRSPDEKEDNGLFVNWMRSILRMDPIPGLIINSRRTFLKNKGKI